MATIIVRRCAASEGLGNWSDGDHPVFTRGPLGVTWRIYRDGRLVDTYLSKTRAEAKARRLRTEEIPA